MQDQNKKGDVKKLLQNVWKWDGKKQFGVDIYQQFLGYTSLIFGLNQRSNLIWEFKNLFGKISFSL